MNVIQSAIRYPVTSTVGVLFIILFGVVSLLRLPIQLTPDVTKEGNYRQYSMAWSQFQRN